MNDVNPGAIVLLILMLTFYLVPSIVAYRRGHHYRHVILALNVIGGITGIGWAVAMVWAVWPEDKSLADPVLGNVTGKGFRNAGDTMGGVAFGQSRGYEEERIPHQQSREKALPQHNPSRRNLL